jgi:uncharacterized lipoprotein
MRLILPALLLLLLAACNREDAPERPTAAQTAQLDEAENMLDNLAANEEGPDNASAPAGPSGNLN